MPSLHDTRLLSNLLKTEKDSAQAFKQYTLAAQSASAALSAWSVADSTGTGDLMDAAIRISQLLSTITDSQRLYLTSLTTYRSSLKDVLAREQALRTVVRDREILVNRLIKIGNKRPKDGAEREHEAKLEDAQRELQACETFLQEEELALAHAKRRSFREALNARMQAMNALSHVMDDCSVEAVDILSTLQSDNFEPAHPDGDVQLRREYDLGSDAGDSIAPSQSASQAMSRASSSSSLSSLNLQQAPPIPHNLQIDPSSRARSTSPSRAAQVPLPASPVPRAKSPARVTSTLPPPVMMPPVPSAPPPVSSQVYTERQPGLPTFEIPKAPNLLRRPDESSSDEEDEQYGGLRRNERSSHYPLDSPAYEQPARLRRRAASDTSSIRGGGGGRKRKGSFLGGLASLFRRNKNRDRDSMSVRDFETGGSADYAGARSRLANSAGGGGGAADGRNDAVMRSVMNAGRVPARRRAGADADSSDDDVPRHLTKHVNDPKARIKALSDVGRPSSPAMPVSSASAGRPKLQRKGTSASTVRPMSVAGVPGHETAPRRKKASSTTGGTKKVKKAASDIGVTSSGWKSTAPPASLQVPKAPTTDGIADLATGVSLPPPPAPINFPSPAFAPRQSGGTPAAPAETGSLKRKKTKKVPAAAAPSGSVTPTQPAAHAHGSKHHHPDTVILSAEALGIPTAGAIPQPQQPQQQQGLVRSNTTSTQATTIKRKKKKSVVPPNVDGVTANGVHSQQKALPTADQLAATLPHAVSGSSALNAHLPRPDEDTNAYQHTTKQPRPVSSATVTPASTQPTSTQTPANKPIISLAAQEKRSKRLSALHGDANWVQHPPPPAAAPRASRGRAGVHEGEESLLSVVDRAEGAETVQPSRTYGAQSTVAGTNGGLSPPSAGETPDRSTSSTSTPQLSKRKSVRLAETSEDASAPKPTSTLSPSSSIRSATSAPRPGILIQRDPSPVPGSLAASLQTSPSSSHSHSQGDAGNWPTRASLRAAMADSSDEEGSDGEGMKAYRQARKMLGGRTREMQRALTREEKGKGRAE
ncbi:hypothetical protein JCM10049v2_000840 [Rhodotorula toruloides]